MLFHLFLLLFIQTTKAEKYYEIEDIPIEQFEHADAQSDAFDVELMPRSSRSIYSGLAYQSPNIQPQRATASVSDFEKLFENIPVENFRTKRSAKVDEDLVKDLGKPLELDVIESENLTENSQESNVENTSQKLSKRNTLTVNDFIRFKRSSEQEDLIKGIIGDEKDKKSDDDQSKKDLIPVLRDTLTEKLVFNPEEQAEQKDSAREPRGITKKQWVKQPYLVQKSDDELNLSDNVQASTENLRAPRVHFVTHGMVEAPTNNYKYDRERRGRNSDYDIRPRDFSRDLSTEMDYYHPRYMRNYAPARNRYRDDRYFHPEPEYLREPYPYDRTYDYPERRKTDYNANSSTKRLGRIIYYANLPEVTRAPPLYRDRYDSRSRNRYYDDRYYSPYPYRKDTDAYADRKDHVKPRYEEHAMDKSRYPTVKNTNNENRDRDSQKNQERRLYSENDRAQFSQNNNQR